MNQNNDTSATAHNSDAFSSPPQTYVAAVKADEQFLVTLCEWDLFNGDCSAQVFGDTEGNLFVFPTVDARSQSIVLISENARAEYGTGSTFDRQLDAIAAAALPVVFVLLDGSRQMPDGLRPPQFNPDYFTIEVPFDRRAIAFALSSYVSQYFDTSVMCSGAHFYHDSLYERLGLA